MDVKQILRKLAQAQYEIALKETNKINKPINGFADLNDTLAIIFQNAVNKVSFHRNGIGNDPIKGSLVATLVSQYASLKDMPYSELKEGRPFNMSIKSVINLAKEGHLYINLLQYDYCNDDVNEDIFDGLDKETFDFLRELVEDLVDLREDGTIKFSYIYIMTAMRKPVFDKLLENEPLFSYAGFQRDCLSRIETVGKTFDTLWDTYNDYRRDWRGRKHDAKAASYHYAYLKSANTLLKSNYDFNIFDYGNYSFEKRIQHCAELGDDLKKNYSDERKKEAADYFGELAMDLRVLHTLHTLQVTGSWGCMWNRPFNEYVDFKLIEADIINKIERNSTVKTDKIKFTQMQEYKNLIFELFCERKNLSADFCTMAVNGDVLNKSFTDDEIKKLIDFMRNNTSTYRELAEAAPAFDSAFANKDFDEKTVKIIKDRIKYYNDKISFIDGKLCTGLEIGVPLTIGIALSNPVAGAAISLLFSIAGLSKKHIFKKIFLGSPENQTAFYLNEIILPEKKLTLKQ